MIKMAISRAALLATVTTLIISSCREKGDLSAPDVYANFENNAQGITAAENSITIKVKLSSAAAADIPVVLNVAEQGVVSGTDYNIIPAPAAGKIHLVIPSGNNEASFTLTKVTGKLFDGDEKIVFDIYSSGTPAIIGNTRQLTLTFAELVANTTTMVVNGGGPTFPNKVFIDISAERQTGINRGSWDLGFYTGAEYRVTLNASVNMMVKQLNKNDLNTVTPADTVGLTADLGFSQTAPAPAQMPYYDYPSGDLTRTAIAEVSANAADNKVYIVNRGSGVGTSPARGWRKIRITRNASGGYTLQHAALDATTFSSLDIAKDAAFYFKYASFENGVVEVEPQKAKWDIAWSYFANVTNFGGGEVPYMFQDIILINRGVSVAAYVTTPPAAPLTFDTFTAADITALTFKTTQNAIGADWRNGGGPSTSPSVKSDRFYIVKDADNNYYKLQFTALTNGGGERGYPAYKAVWLKKG